MEDNRDIIQKQVADMGFNPQMKELIERLQKETPELNLETKVIIFSLILAIGDMIIANNRALAKSIPHIES